MGEVWRTAGIGAAVGIGCFAAGMAVHRGHFRDSVRARYVDRRLPPYFRNSPLALIPTGLAFLLPSAAMALAQLLPSPDAANVTVLLGMMIGLGCGIFAVRCVYRPPGWLMPRWLRDSGLLQQPAGGLSRALDDLPGLIVGGAGILLLLILLALMGAWLLVSTLRAL